jgi:hypothetical protein
MPKQNLDVEVFHHAARVGKFQAFADPEDLQWLEGRLRGWLQARRWNEKRWGEFEIVTKKCGEGRVITRARAES